MHKSRICSILFRWMAGAGLPVHAVLLTGLLAGLIAPASASTWCVERFWALNIKHIEYNVVPIHERIIKTEFLLRAPGGGETIIQTGAGTLAGSYRQILSVSGAYTFHLKEYFWGREYVQNSSNDWVYIDVEVVYTGDPLCSVQINNQIGGRMLQSEDIDCANANLSGNPVMVPTGMTLALRNTGSLTIPAASAWNVDVDGILLFDRCKNVQASVVANNGTMQFYQCETNQVNVSTNNCAMYFSRCKNVSANVGANIGDMQFNTCGIAVASVSSVNGALQFDTCEIDHANVGVGSVNGAVQFDKCRIVSASVGGNAGTLIFNDNHADTLITRVPNQQIRRSCLGWADLSPQGSGTGLLLEDSLIWQHANIVTRLDCQIKKNEFRDNGNTTMIGAYYAGSSINGNLFLSAPRFQTTGVWPDVQNNYFLGGLTVSDTNGCGTNAIFSVPNNYWGGLGGPLCLANHRNVHHWLDDLGGANLNFGSNETYISTRDKADAWPKTAFPDTDRPFPSIGLAAWGAGQGTLPSSFMRQGRNILVCADVRAAALALPGVVFSLRYNGKELAPLNPNAVLKLDWGNNDDINRTINFLIPAGDTHTNRIDAALWCDASGVSGYRTPGPVVCLGTMAIGTIHRPPARKLRIGIVPIPLPWVLGYNTLSLANVDKVAARLDQDLYAMTPLGKLDYEIVRLPSYYFNTGSIILDYTSLMTTYSMTLRVSRELELYRIGRDLSDFGPNHAYSPCDFLVAVMPADSMTRDVKGMSYPSANVILVDETDTPGTIHELGHQLGLYTTVAERTEQYDLEPAGFSDPRDPNNQISLGLGAGLYGLTAFNPEWPETHPEVQDQILHHFPFRIEASTASFTDIMGFPGSDRHQWMIPSSYLDFAQGLYHLLGEAPEAPAQGGNGMTMANAAPAKPSPLPTGTRHILVQGLWRRGAYTPKGDSPGHYVYELIPETVRLRDLTGQTTNTVPVEAQDWIGVIDAWDAKGRIMTIENHGCIFNDAAMGIDYTQDENTNVPPIVAWSQTFDIPDNAASLSITEFVNGGRYVIAWNRATTVSNSLSGPVAGGLTGTRTFSWQNQNENSSRALPIQHQLYYSADGQTTWTPLGNPTADTNLTVDADSMPASANLAFKLISSDGFQQYSSTLAGYSVSNHSPTARILQPLPNAQADSNQVWTLSGSACDPEDGVLSGGSWQIAGGAMLGTGSLVNVTLPSGANTLIYSVQDLGGATASAGVTVFVRTMTNSDLYVATNALSLLPIQPGTSAYEENHIYWNRTNLLTITVRNQGVTNDALLSLYLMPPVGGEQLLAAQALSNWTAFGSDSLSAEFLPAVVGVYQVRAVIQALGLPDPDTNNNTCIWSLGDDAPQIEDYRFIANATGMAGAVFSAYDPNGGTPTYAVVTQPANGAVTFNGSTAIYNAAVGYVGDDSFTYHVISGGATSRVSTVSVTMPGVPQISGGITVTGQVGQAFAYGIQANRQPYFFEAEKQGGIGLPSGLHCNRFTGDIRGTPDEEGAFTIALSAYNFTGAGTSSVQFVILPAQLAPVILSHPQSQNVPMAGIPVQFSITASGVAPIFYQWLRNGINVVGATNNTFTILSTQTANAGRYQCIASNWAGAATSAVATLSVGAMGPPDPTHSYLAVSYSPASSGFATLNPQSDNDGQYANGTVVTVTAVPRDSDYTFSSWSGGASGTTNPIMVTMNSSKSITANFSNFVESVSTPSNVTGTAAVHVNQSTEYTASGAVCTHGHAVQYRFDLGDGIISSWGNATQAFAWNSAGARRLKAQSRCAVNTAKQSGWSAELVPITVTTLPLTIQVSPVGNGTVGRNLLKSGYNYDDTVTLTALPNAHWQFANWTGDVPLPDAARNPLPLTMTQARNVTCVFAAARTLYNTPELWLLQHFPAANDFADAALSDTDGDGMAAWQEWWAGTDPTNATSFFAFSNLLAQPGSNGFILGWRSVTGRQYAIFSATNLANFDFQLLTSGIPGAAGGTVWTDSVTPEISARLYRIAITNSP